MSPTTRSSGALVAWFVALMGSSTAAAVPVGEAPPPLDLPDLEGNLVSLQELRGKVVLVDFWASWCGPCKAEMPVLQMLHDKYDTKGLAVIGVSIDGSTKKMKGFLKRNPVSFRIVHDAKMQAAQRYEPRIMPSSYFVDRDGKLRHVHEGFESEDAEEIEARIQKLLAERAGD